MRLYLAAPPHLLREAGKWGLTPVHMAYRIAGGVFMRDAGSDEVGGAMALRVSGGAGPELARDVLRECRVRSFEGVFLESEDGAPLTPFAQALAAETSVRYGSGGKNYGAFISTEVYRGSFAESVRRAAGNAPFRAAADLSVGFRLYSPPCPDGRCSRLTGAEAAKYLASAGKSFFSEKLCVNYTAVFAGGRARFLLFDTPESVASKICALRAAGIESAVLLYSENTPDTLRAAIAAAGK